MDQPLQVRALEQKAALRQMFDECGIPHKAIADMLGKAYSTFQSYLDPSQDVHMPSYLFPVALAVCTKSTALIAYHASLQNAVVVKLPEADEVDRSQLPGLLRELAHVLEVHADANSDGRWTAEEAARWEVAAMRAHAKMAAETLYIRRQAVVPFSADRRRA